MFYPISPVCGPVDDNLIFWENFFTEDEILRILALPDWLKAEEAKVGNKEGEVNRQARVTKVSWLPMDESTQWIYQKIAITLAEVNSRFYNFELTGLHEKIQLGIYAGNDNGHYDWHMDDRKDIQSTPRKLSMALLLSDPSEFEGGKLQVKNVSDVALEVEQKRGRAWFFPSYTLHRVTPVTSGIRRSLVVWAGGPKFK